MKCVSLVERKRLEKESAGVGGTFLHALQTGIHTCMKSWRAT